MRVFGELIRIIVLLFKTMKKESKEMTPSQKELEESINPEQRNEEGAK
jgi:hypothetical protein